MHISHEIRTFFTPLFLKHKTIFLLLMLSGVISWVFSVVMPLLLKWETDQLMGKQTLLGFTAFEVFAWILGLILLLKLFQRVISRIADIYLEARKEFFHNDIQLQLFNRMNYMEPWRTFSGRYKNLSEILWSEFTNFANTILHLPWSTIQKAIEIVGITALFAYFDIRLLAVTIIWALCSYYISHYADILRQKYDIQWQFSLGQKMYFYRWLFLGSFSDLANNGAVRTTLDAYRKLLDEQIRHGLKKNWADLNWVISWTLSDIITNILIKMIVGYSVFQWTQSIGIVALAVSSMDTVSDILANTLSLRKDYRRFRMQESSILLFFEMSSPIGEIDTMTKKLENIEIKNLTFSYPTTYDYEREYMHIIQEFFKDGKSWDRYIDEKFEEYIESLTQDLKNKHPDILKDISLTLRTGKIYGIVGKNGAGKTTLMHLLSWMFRSYDGDIIFDNQSTRDWTPELYAEQVSFLTQQPFFMEWGSTVEENILLWVKDHDPDILWGYLEKFWIAHKIKESKKWLESSIGDDIDFSWGEKQIIACIRVLLQDRPIVIMDEWTNQLDAENELLIMNEFLEKKSDKIIIFITHRMSTISRADTIYCLESHSIKKSGTHRELLNQWDNIYAQFYRAQVLHDDV